MDVKILNKSLNVETGDIITSYLLEGFPYDVLAEFNKHRLFSISCESSRARKLSGVLGQVINDPFVPTFTINQPGMSGEPLENQEEAREIYLDLRDTFITEAHRLDNLGVHKQDINGAGKPWMKISQIVTSTHWDNFFTLRRGEGAKGAIKEFADEMYRLFYSTDVKRLKLGEWHMPFPDLSLRENVAKCGSISYANHQKDATKEKLISLHDKLIASRHDVPTEHCAMAVKPGMYLEYKVNNSIQVFDHFDMLGTLENCDPKITQVNVGNFAGFLQYRKFLETGIDIDKHHPNV